MKLLPSEDFYIITELKSYEVQMAVQSTIRPAEDFTFKKLFQAPRSGGFEGWVIDDGFNIKRVVEGRNSFIPSIKGQIMPLANGSRVHITMQLQSEVAVLLYVFSSVFALLQIGLLVDAIQAAKFTGWILVPLAFLLFIVAFAWGGFKPDSNNAKIDLLRLLNGKVED